ncbi:MAG: hypothetical protein SGPRY_003162 [Prymnesium sp.]
MPGIYPRRMRTALPLSALSNWQLNVTYEEPEEAPAEAQSRRFLSQEGGVGHAVRRASVKLDARLVLSAEQAEAVMKHLEQKVSRQGSAGARTHPTE